MPRTLEEIDQDLATLEAQWAVAKPQLQALASDVDTLKTKAVTVLKRIKAMRQLLDQRSHYLTKLEQFTAPTAQVELTKGRTMPNDRVWALTHEKTRFDFVISSAPPLSALLAASTVSSRLRIPPRLTSPKA